MSVPFEQRQVYKGTPRRAWCRVRLETPNGDLIDLDVVADTGCPCSLILGQKTMTLLRHFGGPALNTNFGLLQGGWLKITMPELGLTLLFLGYESEAVRASVQISDPDFEGLAGLPLLRLLEYGGNADSFWLRSLGSRP